MSARPFGLSADWRRQLRDRGPGVLLAVTVGLITLFSTIAPALETTAYDRAIVDMVEDAPPDRRDVRLTLNARPVTYFYGDLAETPLGVPNSPQAPVEERAEQIMGAAAQGILGSPTFSATTVEFSVEGPGRSPIGDSRQAVVRVQAGLDAPRVRWDAGSLLTSATKTVMYDELAVNGSTRRVSVIPVVVPTAVATAWQIAVGDRFALTPIDGGRGRPLNITVELSGTYTPTDPAAALWGDEPRLLTNDAVVAWDGGTSSRAAFMVAPELLGRLGQALRPVPESFGDTSPAAQGLSYEWRYRLDPATMNLATARTIATGINNLKIATTPWADLHPVVTSGLGDVMVAHGRAVAVTKALVTFVTSALLALGSLAAVLLVLVIGTRRAASQRLHAARGADLIQVTAAFTLEILAWTLPVALVTALASWVLVGPPGWAGALTAVPVLAAMVTAVAVAHRNSRLGPGRERAFGGGATRLLVELAALGAASFAVTTTRSRGGQITGGTTDWYAALTPVLLAVAVAVVVLRILPVPLLIVLRGLRGGRSVLGYLGLAQAARPGSAVSAPLAGLLVAAAVASFLGGLGVSIQRERAHAAYELTGADLRIDAARIDPQDVAAALAVPGVRAVVPAFLGDDERVTGDAGTGSQLVRVLAVDARAYAAALAGTPLAFDPSAVGGSGQRMLALTDAALRPRGALSVTVQGSERPIDVVGLEAGLRRSTALQSQPVVLVPWDQALAGQPYLQPNTLFVMGSAEAIARLVREPPPALTEGVTDRFTTSSDWVNRALPAVVRMLILTGLGLAGAFSAISLLVVLTLTRPDRVATLLRMRVLGMRRRRDWLLGLVEVLPAACVAIVAGAGLGLLLPPLMQSAIDLAPFTGGAPSPPIATPLWVALTVTGVLLASTVTAVAADMMRARRTSLSAHLRAGESR